MNVSEQRRSVFSSCYLKIERANQHIADLDTLLSDFIKANPHRIIIHPDSETGQVRLAVDLNKPLPAHCSTITGDAVHNLRTALDHLACALVEAGGGVVKAHTVFPFHEDRDNFEANFEGKIEGASKEAINLVKSMEPYKGGAGNALWRLNKLDVADKHHSLLLAIRVATLPKIIVRKPDGSVQATLINNRVGGDGRINLVRFPPGVTFEIEEQNKVPVEVRFRDTAVLEGKSVIVSLKKLSDIVLGVVQNFEGVNLQTSQD